MQRLTDEVTITVKAGDGGKGCESRQYISWKKFLPTGGEGGRGGNVTLRADTNMTSLADFLYRRHFEAEAGGPGGNNHKRGGKGKDLLIRVPCGTAIFARERHFLIRDLVETGDEVVLLQGGKGGTGNEGKKEARSGERGESLEIILSLKIPADVFLVGLPNSGKSRLLNQLAHTHAKEETYPFTTQRPEIGIYETPDFERACLCELPGVYRQSFEGRGAGIEFLKHLERARLLILMLDPLSTFASSLKEGYEILLEILSRYNASYLEIPRLVVVNKMDLKEARERVEKEKFLPGCPVFLVSAKTGEGIEPLMRLVVQSLKEKSRV